MTPQYNHSSVNDAQSNPILDTFKLVAETQQQIEQVTKQAREAVKTHYHSPEELVTFIEEQGTPVYLVTGWKGLLLRLVMMGLSYDSGFIAPPSPKSNPQALKRYINLCKSIVFLFGTKQTFSFKKGVFILPKPLYTVGFIAHQLHHWLAFLAGLPGYNELEQEEFRLFMGERNGVVGSEVYQMNEKQIEGLRNAIHREIEALKFIKAITNEIFRPARQAKYLSDGMTNA